MPHGVMDSRGSAPWAMRYARHEATVTTVAGRQDRDATCGRTQSGSRL
jgi:hypothetical protein